VTREVGLKQAEDVLAAYPDLTVIYAANDEIALGAAQAVDAAGKTGQIVITGLNGVPQAIKAVKDGTLSFTYDTDGPNWGAVGFNTAIAYAKARCRPTRKSPFTASFVDRSNVDSYLAPAASHH
jgi:ribose transport system substrate-binding protein